MKARRALTLIRGLAKWPWRWQYPNPQPLAGLGHRGTASGTSEIKREEKEDEENVSVADNSEEEKKELKAPRIRTRCQPLLDPYPTYQDSSIRTQCSHQWRSHREASGGPCACSPSHCLPLAPRPPPSP